MQLEFASLLCVHTELNLRLQIIIISEATSQYVLDL